jgi:death-on-curing protein
VESIAVIEVGAGTAADPDVLRSVVELPSARNGDRDAYPGLHLKAAALLEALVRTKPFAWGNERVALLAVTVFLNLNGWDLEAEPDELALLTRMTSQGRLSLFDVAAGLESATVRLTLEED